MQKEIEPMFAEEIGYESASECWLISAFARVILAMGYRVAVNGDGVTVELPAGHVSWRFPPNVAHLFLEFPRSAMTQEFDPMTKAERLTAFLRGTEFSRDCGEGYCKAKRVRVKEPAYS